MEISEHITLSTLTIDDIIERITHAEIGRLCPKGGETE